MGVIGRNGDCGAGIEAGVDPRDATLDVRLGGTGDANIDANSLLTALPGLENLIIFACGA